MLRKLLSIRTALAVLVWIAWYWSWQDQDLRTLSFELQIVFFGITFSGMSPRLPFWKPVLLIACLCGLGTLAFSSPNLSPIARAGLCGLLLFSALFTLVPWISTFVRESVRLEEGDIVFFYPNRIRKREPVANISSYRFDSVWFLELAIKDHSTRRLELPSLSWKPAIQKVMLEAGIPVSSGGSTGAHA